MIAGYKTMRRIVILKQVIQKIMKKSFLYTTGMLSIPNVTNIFRFLTYFAHFVIKICTIYCFLKNIIHLILLAELEKDFDRKNLIFSQKQLLFDFIHFFLATDIVYIQI